MITCAPWTAQAQTPRTIDGVACEVCLSERYIDNQRTMIGACETHLSNAKRQRDQCHGSREQLKKLVTDIGIREQALLKERADLRLDLARAQEGPSWWTVVGVSAGAAVVTGSIVFLVTALR